MKHKAWVEGIEEVAEEHRDLYAESADGGYVFELESAGGFGVGNIERLKKAVQVERRLTTQAKKKVSGFGDRKPEDYADLEAKISELEGAPDLSEAHKKEVARLKRDAEDKSKRDLSEHDAKITKLTAEVGRRVVDSAAMPALAKEKADVALLMPHIRDSLKPVQGEDGTWGTQVVDLDGTPLTSQKSSSMAPMGVDELVGTLKERFPGAFPSQQKPGIGAGGLGGTPPAAGGTISLTKEEMHDPANYARAKEQAEKSGARIEVTES